MTSMEQHFANYRLYGSGALRYMYGVARASTLYVVTKRKVGELFPSSIERARASAQIFDYLSDQFLLVFYS